MSFNNFLDTVIDKAEVKTKKTQEFIHNPDTQEKIVLNKKLKHENKSSNRSP